MTKTEYYTRFINIWEVSATRNAAHVAIQEKLDPDLSYKQMMNKVHYVEAQGILLKKLPRDTVDWNHLRNTFS